MRYLLDTDILVFMALRFFMWVNQIRVYPQ